MPDSNDWIVLKKTINAYSGKIYGTWGLVSATNANELALKKCDGMDLFEFLLHNDHFFEANTIASSIPLVSDTNIQLIHNKHHSKYCDVLQILCTDKMILLYEQYYEKINSGTNVDNHPDYRTVISKRYEKLILDESPTNLMIDTIYQFKFMVSSYLEDFYNFILKIGLDKFNGDACKDNILKFMESYKSYRQIVPLIYRLINEYYIEYIRYQLKMINDLSESSFIIVSEYYENLLNIVNSLPKKYIDYRYQDRFGNNIIMYLATLPFLSDEMNNEIYDEFLKNVDNIPLDILDNNGNNIFHMLADANNEIFLDKLLEWFSNLPNEQMQLDNNNTVGEMLATNNFNNKTVFDILFEKENYQMIMKIIYYMPPKSYSKLTNKLIENFDILDNLPCDKKISQIYISCIDYYIDILNQTKQDVLYDMGAYNNIKYRIIKLLAKCPSEINIQHDCYLEWLYFCIKNNEHDLFNNILSKYFFNEENSTTTEYLSKIIKIYGEPLIITAIKKENVAIIKTLLNYNIDLSVEDCAHRNAMIVSLATNNIYIIKQIRNHISNILAHKSMVEIFDNFIYLLEKCETVDISNIYDRLIKIWKSLEYLINSLFYGLPDTTHNKPYYV